MLSKDNRVKIFFIIHQMATGGATRVVLNLVNNLEEEKFNINLVVFSDVGELLSKVNKGVKIHNLNSSRVAFGAKRLISLLIKEKPKIIFTGITHVNLTVALAIPIMKPFLKDTIFITREVNIPSVRAKYLKKSKKMDYLYKKVISRFDIVIAQSEYMRDDIIFSYELDSTKVLVVNNPIDIEYINKELKDSREEVIFSKDRINIVAVGMLRKQKAFEKLLSIFKLLDDKYHLHIIGEGSERVLLENKIDRLNIGNMVTLHGLKRNPYIYMKEADLVVLSSKYEGFPNVVLEANVCGKFIVANRCAGVNSEIIIDNLNGVLVENDNYQEFADAIKKHALITHNREKIIDTTKKYNVKEVVDIYRDIFLGDKR